MKSITTMTLALLTFSTTAFSQQRFTAAVQILGGLYVHNSENDLPLLQDDKYLLMYGANISFSYAMTDRYALAIDFLYVRSNAPKALQFTYSTGDLVSTFDSKIFLNEYSADIGLRFISSSWLQFGLGPSVGIVTRQVKISYANVDDKLNSLALGIHGDVIAITPSVKQDRSFYTFCSLKIRYLHSVAFDSRGRDLSNYSQSFLTIIAEIGIGYAF